jgi:hypothetical protein
MAAKRRKKHKNQILGLVISMGLRPNFENFDFLRDCQTYSLKKVEMQWPP